MKYTVIVLLLLSLFNCKNNKREVQLDQTVIDSIKKNNVEIDSILIEKKLKEQPKSYAAIKAELEAEGFEVFDYVDKKTNDTILMQQYFMAFLKAGAIRNQNEEEAQELQQAHLAHLTKMYELGFSDISGPMGDDGDIRGVTIYNVPTLKMADSLANLDPMVKAGRLEIEIHPWWAAKEFCLR